MLSMHFFKTIIALVAITSLIAIVQAAPSEQKRSPEPQALLPGEKPHPIYGPNGVPFSEKTTLAHKREPFVLLPGMHPIDNLPAGAVSKVKALKRQLALQGSSTPAQKRDPSPIVLTGDMKPVKDVPKGIHILRRAFVSDSENDERLVTFKRDLA